MLVRSISRLLWSETTLGCMPQLTGRLSKARNLLPLSDENSRELRHFPKSPARSAGLSAVLGQNALGKAGDCNAARRKAIWCGQERKSRSTSCPLLAQSGHSAVAQLCLLLGVKRTVGLSCFALRFSWTVIVGFVEPLVKVMRSSQTTIRPEKHSSAGVSLKQPLGACCTSVH